MVKLPIQSTTEIMLRGTHPETMVKLRARRETIKRSSRGMVEGRATTNSIWSLELEERTFKVMERHIQASTNNTWRTTPMVGPNRATTKTTSRSIQGEANPRLRRAITNNTLRSMEIKVVPSLSQATISSTSASSPETEMVHRLATTNSICRSMPEELKLAANLKQAITKSTSRSMGESRVPRCRVITKTTSRTMLVEIKRIFSLRPANLKQAITKSTSRSM